MRFLRHFVSLAAMLLTTAALSWPAGAQEEEPEGMYSSQQQPVSVVSFWRCDFDELETRTTWFDENAAPVLDRLVEKTMIELFSSACSAHKDNIYMVASGSGG